MAIQNQLVVLELNTHTLVSISSPVATWQFALAWIYRYRFIESWELYICFTLYFMSWKFNDSLIKCQSFTIRCSGSMQMRFHLLSVMLRWSLVLILRAWVTVLLEYARALIPRAATLNTWWSGKCSSNHCVHTLTMFVARPLVGVTTIPIGFAQYGKSG